MAEPLRPLLTRLTLLGGAEEATAGTAEIVSSALAATAVYESRIQPGNVYEGGQRSPGLTHMDSLKSVATQLLGTLSFRLDITPGDKTIQLMSGCGYVITGTAAALTSSQSAMKTWTFKQYENGRYKQLYGCSGDFTISLEVGKVASVQYDFSGIWGADAAGAMPSNPTLTTLPYVCKAMTLTLGGATLPRASKCTIRGGVEIVPLVSFTGTEGIAYYTVVGRNPQITIDTEARLTSDLDTYGLLTTPTEAAFSAVLTRGANTFTIAAPKAQRVMVTDGDRNGVRLDEITLDCNASSGNDSLSFTEA